MTKKIYAGFLPATMVSLLLASGCSDNQDQLYEPHKIDTELEVGILGGQFSENSTLNLTSAASSTKLVIQSNTQWSVNFNDDAGSWCSASVYRGMANDTITLNVLQNLGNERRGTVVFNTIDAEGNTINTENGGSTYSFTVIQSNSSLTISPSDLDPFAAINPAEQEFRITTNENINWTLSVTYEATQTSRFISVSPDDNMRQVEGSDSEYEGYGSAGFSISLSDNVMEAERIGYLTLTSEIGNYPPIEIKQLGTEYVLSVSVNGSRDIPADGGSIRFEVFSPQSAWKVSGAPDWLTFDIPDGKADPNSSISVNATVAPNPYQYDRSATIMIESTADNASSYPKFQTNIVQLGNDFTFQTDVEADLGVIMEEGGELTLNVDSRFDWRLDLPSWVTSDKTSGTGSISNQKVTLNIVGNRGDTRNGNVKVIPLPTSFAGLGQINPENMGIAAHVLRLTQYGGHEPAVSVPWVTDIGQTSATVEFNYYSPFYDVTEAGLRWRRLGEDTWHTVEDLAIADSHTGYVTCRLDGLTAATQYEFRGYVVYRRDDSDVTKEGAVSGTPLTTAGTRPGGGDNPTPGI